MLKDTCQFECCKVAGLLLMGGTGSLLLKTYHFTFYGNDEEDSSLPVNMFSL